MPQPNGFGAVDELEFCVTLDLDIPVIDRYNNRITITISMEDHGYADNLAEVSSRYTEGN